MIDPGVVGSPTDVATLIVAGITLKRLVESQLDGHAATVAVAEEVEGVDDDRVRADLDVEPRASEQYLADGGRS